MKKAKMIGASFLFIAFCAVCFFIAVSCGEPKKYALIYYTDGGEELDNEEVTLEEFSNKQLPTPAKEGYSFLGWYIDSELTIILSDEYIPEGDTISLYAKWQINKYKVSITSNRADQISNIADFVEQEITCAEEYKPVNVSVNFGYVCRGYEYDGAFYSSSTISLPYFKCEDMTINIVIDYATYELPIVDITANEEVTSKDEYVDMRFNLTNSDYSVLNARGEIRVRGNSTTAYKKLPYRIKFSTKQSLFGLTAAKSWVLLADYLDPSTLHNYVALSLGKQSDALSFTCTPYKVNLYLNGEYLGLYTLCEQVQTHEGRLDIEKEITEDMTDLSDYNFFISMDKSILDDETAVLDEDFFCLDGYRKYIVLKYPTKEDFPSEEQFKSFFKQLKSYVTNIVDILNTPNSYNTAKNYINVNSLVDFWLIDVIMGEYDHKSKSFNMYYTTTSSNPEENGKLNFGPIWDYDWCLNTPWTDEPNECYVSSVEIKYNSIFYSCLAADTAYQTIIKERWNKVFKNAMAEIVEGFDSLVESFSVSLKMNGEKWYGETEIVDDNIAFFKRYLIEGYEYLCGIYSI